MNSSFRRRLLMVSCILAALVCSAPLWADPPSRVGRLNVLDGAVSFRPATLDEWAPATLNYPLTTGDNLWTAAGARAELHVGSASVRLGAETDFSILFLDDRRVQLRLSLGSVDIRLRDLQADEDFEIATPEASISLLEPGSYRIDVQADGATDIVVRSGQVEMAAGSSSISVSANQYAALTDPNSVAFEFRVAPPPDEWELWCMQRDEREDRYATSRYVPASMVGYEDLDEWGSWQALSDYGMAWRPRGVPAGWAPYHFGHWAWVGPWGWTWIDDAPWGFAPFHYGRWVFLQGAWFWVPGAFVARPVYVPALVVFIGGAGGGFSFSFGEGIGWFPLGPHEVYVPPYRASDAYVRNVNSAYVAGHDGGRIDVPHVRYVNRSTPGAVTVVSRQAFVRAEPVALSAVRLGDADVNRAPVTGMGPSFAPERDSILARPQAARQSVPRPPASALDRPVIVRQAPPPGQSRDAQQAGAPAQPRVRVVNPPPREPLAQPPAQPQQPFEIRQRTGAPAPQGRQPGEFRPPQAQPQPQAQPRPQGPAVRQVSPDAPQDRSGPAVVPQSPRKAGPSASSQRHLKRVRKLVDGPNGPEWVWVEEEEPGAE